MERIAPSDGIREPALIRRGKFFRFVEAACAHLEEMGDGGVEEHQRRPTIAAERPLALRESDHLWLTLFPYERAGAEKSPSHGVRSARFPAVLAMAQAGLQGGFRKGVSHRTA
jgi:hypothetical protein